MFSKVFERAGYVSCCHAYFELVEYDRQTDIISDRIIGTKK